MTNFRGSIGGARFRSGRNRRCARWNALVVALVAIAAWPVCRVAGAATFTVTNGNTSGAGSLAQAITSANATAEPDLIQFNIFTLTPLSIGGTLPAITQPVTIDGYTAFASSENTATGTTSNANIRIEINGTGRSNGSILLDIQASGTIVRGLAIRNIPANGTGIRIGAGKSDVAILGSFIGTDAGGVTKRSDGTGILVEGAAIIGTGDAGDRNVVVANSGPGIELRGSGSTVDNNILGLDADGNPGIGNEYGILFTDGAGGNDVGEEARNVIAGNDSGGIRVAADAGDGNRFGRNNIYMNTGLGIDLGAEGPDEIDDGDVDDGPNGLQNAPDLSFVRRNGDKLTFRGALRSSPGQYRILLYGTTPDSSGYGEGENWRGGTILTIPDGRTSQTFAISLTGSNSEEFDHYTATAEQVTTGNTSEFSRWTRVADGGFEYVVMNTADSGAGSLRTGLSLAMEGPESYTILFDIPGAGPHTIVAPTPLNLIGAGGWTIIDGYSQSLARPNTLAEGSNADIRIQLTDGNAQDQAAVVHIENSSTILQGLAIHSGSGHGVRIVDTIGVELLGNFIGTDAAGTADLGNAENGISIDSSSGITVGGALPAYRNVISGNDLGGIADFGGQTRIAGNLIGLLPGLQPLGNGERGIWSGGDGAFIGGTGPGSANRIAYNDGPGIEITGSGASVNVVGNSITANDGLGIDLGTPGVTPNDANDTDTGPNALQNFPVLTSVEISDDSFVLQGTLDVDPAVVDPHYLLRVYASSACDASGHGEGERFLGSFNVTIDKNVETFQRTVAKSLAPGEVVTATATDSLGRTSEFSACFETPGGTVCGDASGNEALAAGDALLVLKTAVGTENCALCTCDVNSSGGITSSDALLVLKAAVGQGVTLDCPGC